ncbi:MAG: HugZ family protein [Bradyrhizobiaceae bacterium]|nr:MAG: HugZ family protein [Bradyrhizobiaceae bacterium]
MIPPLTSFDPAEAARLLLRRSRQGALATLMPHSGDPYCSLVATATDVDGSPLLLISRLAIHTKNILADARVSLMLDERGEEDPLQGARIMLAGTARGLSGDGAVIARRRYLAAQPSAETFADFPDFGFFRIEIQNAHLVAGFGRIVDLTPDRFLTDVSDASALIAAEPDAIAHMNADHRDALNLYATVLLKAAPGDWMCTGCDPDGLDMQNGRQILRLPFPQRATEPGALRKVLKNLADQARTTA